MNKPILGLIFASALTIGGIGMASAGTPKEAPLLPGCTGGSQPSACILPLKNGDFRAEDVSFWNRVGLPSRGEDAEGNTYATLYTGSGMTQAVYAHTGLDPADAVYTLRFRVRAEHAQTQVRATLAMSTDQHTNRVELGQVTTMAVTGDWRVVELSVQGRPYAAPAHVLVEINNEGGTHTTVQVDDVVLVQSADTDLVGR